MSAIATTLSRDIQVDPEFRALIPALTPGEYQQLEMNLIADGCRDPLVTWNNLLIDGHNRKEICERLGLTYITTEVELDDREAAKAWIIQNQFGRRNLQPFQRAELALKLEPLLPSHQGERSDLVLNSERSYERPQNQAAKLASLGHDTYAKAKVIADRASEEVKDKLRRGDPGMSINKAYTAIVLQDRDDEKKARLTAVVMVDNTGLVIGDFREKACCIPDESAELVFTDPPYDQGSDSVDLYAAAAREAARILKPGGSLIAYSGHCILFDAKSRMEEYLRYYWLNAVVHGGEKATRMNRYNIVTRWKPLLWFVKERRGTVNFVDDVVSGQREKSHHDWQQAESEAAYYIEKLTSPHGLVVDFFAGSGTTCIAAQKLGRPWIAFEIDPVTAQTADQRIGGRMSIKMDDPAKYSAMIYRNAMESLSREERFPGEHNLAQQVIDEASAEDIKAYDRRLRVVNAHELLTMEIPPREHILEPIVQTQSTNMVFSKRGVGKTYFSMGIGCAVAAGASFLRWKAPKPRQVLYVDGEMPAITMRERLAAIIAGFHGDMDPSYFRLITPDLQPEGMPSLSGTLGQSLVEDRLNGTELLILDNLSSLCRGGKENEAESWLPIQDWVLSLRRRGISVLFDHHAGKGGAQRGTSRREDILDTVLCLRHSDDYNPQDGARFEVHFEKARSIYGPEVDPFEVRMETREGAAVWLMNSLENVTTAKASALFQDGASIRDVAKELGISHAKSQRLKAKFGGGNV